MWPCRAKAAGQPALEEIAAIRAEEKAHMALQAAIKSRNSQVIAAAQNTHYAAEALMVAFCGVALADIGTMRGWKTALGMWRPSYSLLPSLWGIGSIIYSTDWG